MYQDLLWLKRPLSILLRTFGLIACLPIICLAEDLIIKSDNIYYQAESQKSTLKNARIYHKGLVIHSDRLLYQHDKNIIRSLSPVEIKKEDQLIKAKSFLINLDSETGHFKSLKGKWRKVYWQIERINFRPNFLDLSEIEFSPCEPKRNFIFKIKCQEALYTISKNSLSTKKNHVQFFNRRIKLPNHRINHIGRATKSYGFGIPQFSQNRFEGGLIESSFTNYSSPKLSTEILVGYSTNKNFKIGGKVQAFISPKQQISYSHNYYTSDFSNSWLRYSFTHNLQKKERLSPLDFIFESDTETQEKSELTFSINHFKNQYINYEIIDAEPEIALAITQIPIYKDFFFTQNFRWGNYQEGAIKDSRFLSDSTIKSAWKAFPYVYASAELETILRYYSQQKTWQQHYLNLYFKPKKFSKNIALSYKKNMIKPIGKSPFKFDSNNIKVNDELGLSLSFPLGKTFQIGSELDYDLTTEKFRDIKYILKAEIFCNVNLELKLSTVWENFSVNLNINEF